MMRLVFLIICLVFSGGAFAQLGPQNPAIGQTVINARIYGLSQSNSATQNRIALQAAATAACAQSGGAQIYIQSGTYTVDVSGGIPLNIPCSSVSIKGDGSQSTLFLISGNGTFIEYSPAPGQQYGGYAKISDFRVYTAANPTSGVGIFSNWAASLLVKDVEIDGMFNGFSCRACLDNHITDSTFVGNNSTSGSSLMTIYRTVAVLNTSVDTPSGSTLPFSSTVGVNVGQKVTGSNIPGSTIVSSFIPNVSVTLSNAVSGDVGSGTSITFADLNPSELYMTSLDVRAGRAGGYQNALVINDVDGIGISNSHFGFTSAEALLVQAANISDNITGITCTNTTFDTAATYGVRFKASSGYTGTNAFHRFVGCGAEISGLDGLETDDPQLTEVAINGWVSTLNQNNGINLLTGSHIQITGGQMNNDNLSGGAYTHITVNGATNVTIVGVDFSQSQGSIPYNVALTSGNYVTLGPNNNADAATGDFSSTGAVHNYTIITGTTDNTGVGPHMAMSNNNSAWDIQDVGQTLQIHNYSNSDQFIVLNASTDTVTIGTNGAVIFTANATGIVDAGTLQANGTSSLGNGSANYVTVAGAATTVAPKISAIGSDTNINLLLTAQAAGGIFLQSNGVTAFQASSSATTESNNLGVGAVGTGGIPDLYAEGYDNNIGIELLPKGSGLIQFGNSASFTAASNCGSLSTSSGCLTIKDNNGNTVYLPVYGSL